MQLLAGLLLVRNVTCTCEPPRAAGAPVATMDIPPAALLRFPSSTYVDDLREFSDSFGSIDSPKIGDSSQYLGEIWGMVEEGIC